MLRVSNIAHLPTKPDQVAKAGRLERKPKQPSIKSSTLPKPKRKQYKEVKTSLQTTTELAKYYHFFS